MAISESHIEDIRKTLDALDERIEKQRGRVTALLVAVLSCALLLAANLGLLIFQIVAHVQP